MVERNEGMVVNRQEAREGFWGEHHDLLSCRAWCRETHRIAAATRRGWSVGGGCGEEKHTGLEGQRCGGFFEKKILLHNFNVVIKTGSGLRKTDCWWKEQRQ